MSVPDLRRLALIRTALADGKSFKTGTGYLITKRLVLTAGHVVPEDALKVDVRFESTKKWHEVKRTNNKLNVPWRGKGDVDALLLEIETVPDIEPVQWLESELSSNAKWESTAYPDAAKERSAEGELLWSTSGLSGMIEVQGGRGQVTPQWELTVEAPAKAEAWAGASGAPVFVGERLAGLLKKVPVDFSGSRLYGVRAQTLLADAEFLLGVAEPWLSWPADRRWVLILDSQEEGGQLVDILRVALENFNRDHLSETRGEPFATEPIVVPIAEAISSPERWLALVKALCIAPVVVADVSGFEPGIMLALGVRAVVRRGVTITSSAKPTDLNIQPFNIKESKLMVHFTELDANDSKHPFFLISRAIRDGLLESNVRTNYLDLPAFDGVRCAASEARAGSDINGEALVLCSFSDGYSKERNWTRVSVAVRQFLKKKPVRMLEIESPRLVGQALYEYMRWVEHCIVDWSEWRPNVFFEMGVRLACSAKTTLCLIETLSLVDEAGGKLAKTSQRQKLIDLFAPREYDRQLDKDLRFRDLSKTPDFKLGPVPNAATYEAARANFVWNEDKNILKPHRVLTQTVREAYGGEKERPGHEPILFAERNPAFKNGARGIMLERLIAGWCYLMTRFAEPEMRDSEWHAEVRDQAEILLRWIPDPCDDPYLRRLKNEVVEHID